MVNLYVANTDNDWFDFLAAQPDVPEVNFWRPGPQNFHAIRSGELFVFRLRSPRGRIGGFGVLSNASVLPLQVAWEAFGQSNGVSTYDRFQAKIAQLRPQDLVGPATNIGCRILVQPVFFARENWLELPQSWSSQIQGGKRYSTDEMDGLRLWNPLQDLAQAQIGSQPSNAGLAESGVMKDVGAEKLFRDAAVWTHLASDNVQRLKAIQHI
jgi:putative restriction endonuclease